MASPERGWRKITHETRRYYWRAKGTDDGISVVIATDESFVAGQSGQKLLFSLDYEQKLIQQDGVSLRLATIVSPKVVSLAIQYALTTNPPFTGEPEGKDMWLEGLIVAKLQQAALMTIR
jgi:hypothetical protein